MADKTTTISESLTLVEELFEENMKHGWGTPLELNLDEVPLRIHQDVIPVWLDQVHAYMKTTINLACGVAYMKGHTAIEEEDMRQALVMHKKGINKYLPHDSRCQK